MKPRRDTEEIVKIELIIKENQETSPELCITDRNSASNRRKTTENLEKTQQLKANHNF